MPADRLYCGTVTGRTVFGDPAECGVVFPAPDFPTARAAVQDAFRAGRMEPLTPGSYPEMSVVICVFEVPVTPAVVRAVRASNGG